MTQTKGSFAIVETHRGSGRPASTFVVDNMTADEVYQSYSGEWDWFTILNKEPLTNDEAWQLLNENVTDDDEGWMRWV